MRWDKSRSTSGTRSLDIFPPGLTEAPARTALKIHIPKEDSGFTHSHTRSHTHSQINQYPQAVISSSLFPPATHWVGSEKTGWADSISATLKHCPYCWNVCRVHIFFNSLPGVGPIFCFSHKHLLIQYVFPLAVLLLIDHLLFFLPSSTLHLNPSPVLWPH